ncbi:MAG: ABC transporter permease [Bacteroidetes bacterium]|mgnify:CR=1 FL=1|nr:MAG: ABC transporter permease [Bacteroidota bacterium]REK08060.1 MAG: ABC transporter permease [Bacteroidota bacterium]REK32265.1 MAG: ABC transporter permease [Bacteroidota bacterium]REK47417.1 MAG: ABC transporter permease [Bacteroidota bacterium]
MLGEIRNFIGKEIKSEWKQKYAFQGLLLYVITTVFVCYLSFRQVIDPPTWNALFWIIQLFAGVTAVAKSFIQESPGRILYYYTLSDPRAIILAKIIYNLILMLALSMINIGFYSWFVGNPVEDHLMFFVAIILGSAGFASVLTMVSAIASKAGNSSTLMSILSFPILIPLLITTIRLSKNAMDGLSWSVNYQYVVLLACLNAMVCAMAYLLFPYLWRE